MKLLYFIKWIFSQIVEGLIHKNQMFRNTMRHETGFAFFIWGATSVGTSLGIMLCLAVFTVATGIHPPFIIMGAWMVLCLLYLVYTGFSLMYNAFKAERAELFNTIKNGR
jgi:threonine/homoserine/homoserine lactone efflux protein